MQAQVLHVHYTKDKKYISIHYRGSNYVFKRRCQCQLLNASPCMKRQDWGAGIILCIRPANERRCYCLTPSPIRWMHTQNDPCGCHRRSWLPKDCPFIDDLYVD